MIDIIFLILASIVSLEMLLIMKFKQSLLWTIKNLNKALNLIKSSNVSDHWKEKMIPYYAINSIKKSLSILIALFVIILFMLIWPMFVGPYIALNNPAFFFRI